MPRLPEIVSGLRLSGSCRCRSESPSPRWGAGTVNMSVRTSEAPVFILLFSLYSRGVDIQIKGKV